MDWRTGLARSTPTWSPLVAEPVHVALLGGLPELRAAFPEVHLSDRYHIHRTRPTLPDRLPDDPGAEDTFTDVARRMVELVDVAVKEAGGEVTKAGWVIR